MDTQPGRQRHTADADEVRGICARHGQRADALIEILIDVQHARGCIADADVGVIAEALNLSRAEVHGVRSFYADFSTTPKGRCVVKLCRAEACQSVGSDALAEQLRARLGLDFGQTSRDGAHTLEAVYCLGNCALGPAAMVNGRLIGRADPGRIDAMIAETAND